SFGIPVIKHVKQIAKKPLDVHLMIVNPNDFVKPFVEAGASILTVHYEACRHLHRTVQQIKSYGVKASVCLNPHTPVDVLTDIIQDLDMVLLMSVNPGFGGQKFIEQTYKKVSQLRSLLNDRNPECKIEVDGGVNFETGKKLLDEGADVLVSGSFIFGAEQPEKIISTLKSL
ncbi:MAG TPA: ribulose-phosphate 3-epimerase, partial [Draconibacterium sp.]|nr:ribulose-phosphate 3-epimerase [Draconibacterium sp.]